MRWERLPTSNKPAHIPAMRPLGKALLYVFGAMIFLAVIGSPCQAADAPVRHFVAFKFKDGVTRLR